MIIQPPIRNHQGEKLDFTFLPGTRTDHLILLGHGVTGSKDSGAITAVSEALAKDGWPCLRFSFSGNGNSEGVFTDSNITKEISELSAIIDQVGTGKKITYIGHSMGGAVGALTVARDDRINRIISLAGLVHTRALIDRIFKNLVPGKDFMKDDPAFPISAQFLDDLNQIDNVLDAVAEIRIPWLLVHGLEDDVVPPSDSHALKARLRGPSELVEIPGANHSFENHHEPVIQAVQSWLKKNI